MVRMGSPWVKYPLHQLRNLMESTQCLLQLGLTAVLQRKEAKEAANGRRASLILPFYLLLFQVSLTLVKRVSEERQRKMICAYLLSLQQLAHKQRLTIRQDHPRPQILGFALRRKVFLQCRERLHQDLLLAIGLTQWPWVI